MKASYLSTPSRPATEDEKRVVRKAFGGAGLTTASEREFLEYMHASGDRLQVTESTAKVLERMGKRMGLIESAPGEREQLMSQFIETVRKSCKRRYRGAR